MNDNISINFKRHGRRATHLVISIPLHSQMGCVDLPKRTRLLTSLHYETSTVLSFKDVSLSVKRNRELDNPEMVHIVVEKQKRPPF